MNNKKLKQLNLLIIITVFAGIVCAFVFAFGYSPNNVNKINNDSLSAYNEGWVLKEYNGEPDTIITLPEKVKLDAEDVVVIMNRVPDDVNSSSVLMFKTEFQNVIVMLDGEQVYSNGVLNDQKLMKNAVPCYNIVDIGTAKPGDVVAIYLASAYKSYSGRIPEVYFGTRGDVVASIFRKNGVAFIFAITLLIVTIILCISLISMRDVSVDKRRAVYAFSFVFLTALWMVLENPIMQLITSNLFGVYMAGMVTLLLLPILYIMYQRCFIVKRRYALIFEVGIYVFAINFLTGVIFQFLNACDFASYMLFTKVLITVGLILLSGIMYLAADTFTDRTIYKNLFANLIITGACLLEAIASLFGFYKPYDGIILEAGIFVFVILVVVTAQKTVIDQMHKERAKVYTGVELEKNVILKKINANLIFSSLNVVINNLRDKDKADSRLVYDTSIYLKHNMDVITNKGKVEFAKELEYIKSYLGMMKAQHKNLSVSIEDKVICFYVPYNTIEPLVENAVINGALRAEGECKLAFRSYERLDCYAIQIVDNGPGISPDKRFHGKEGFMSIKKRLKTMSGATVDVKSRPDRGTILTVKIPKDGYIIKE